jgi:hypothetical protein
MGECQQRRWKEELQKPEERIEMSHSQRQEGISWEQMWWDNRIPKNRTLWFKVHEDKGTRLERKQQDSKH